MISEKGAKNLNKRKILILIDEEGNQKEIIGIRETARQIGVAFQVVQNAIKKGHKAKGKIIKLKT